jgi:hypothetical protein
MLGAVRRRDVRPSGRVAAYIANSRLTRQWIGGRGAAVVHPPVEVAPSGDVPHVHRPDTAIPITTGGILATSGHRS